MTREAQKMHIAVWDAGYCCGLAAAQAILDRCLPEAPTYAQVDVIYHFKAELERQIERKQAASKAALASDDPRR